MIPLTVISFIFGVVLGLRFRALSLVPAMVLILISVAAAALAQGIDLWRPLGAIALTFISLQAGFFAGTFTRPHLLARDATRRDGTKDGQTASSSAPLRTSIE
jgi:energy-coupling factor transporter transmembrane protein EcfT